MALAALAGVGTSWQMYATGRLEMANPKRCEDLAPSVLHSSMESLFGVCVCVPGSVDEALHGFAMLNRESCV